ncbi:sulfite reductase [NADPH] flavoprotein component [Elasticomyces elasticus]|uniref:Sulfite reductase [NADPH] flavoprotein component n=1 Tax=Exophiala sideris TaxID=1016849 RepID=A0ABR0IUX6_9EURO|nr:sulfite reductase [NADPH] flavoprotein component [Elasticomyces elasticus]KAK5021188.1 sulfite reductase [NADPH] flavoprotein component [Exophiala sideris]KAK5023785.1 sulfite reductase [NADPH] flavoprotein component [Exophiala sideris]KAK5048864.1 sulfite reductase [NADPH] flavoprotein component [Exophiala sideris]KAK5176346.1 sulfite reductase [NADPH] flavoprotein component [Eurotiomycetes sp. CCFEE 6388]
MAPSQSPPFGQLPPLSSVAGPTYVTAQTLVQQVAYTLSDKIFSYSPESFDLDVAAKAWAESQEQNANGYSTAVQSMQIRNGAGAIALGYMFSKDFDLKKRHIPQGLLAPSSALTFLKPVLDQLSLLYPVSNPFVAHIAALDYEGKKDGGLVVDYAAALSTAEDLGLGLVSSLSAHEIQHMSLFATLLAQDLPSLHVYDGLRIARDTTRVIDILDKSGLGAAYQSVLKSLSDEDRKHLSAEGKALKTLRAVNEELGTDYKPFEYSGHEQAEVVLVTFGSVESSLAAQAANALAQSGSRVGAINVRLYRPFADEQFLRLLPHGVKVIGVLGQVVDAQAVQEAGVHSQLYEDVLASVAYGLAAHSTPEVRDLKYARAERWVPSSISALFQSLLGKTADDQGITTFLDDTVQQYTFWNVDDAPSTSAATFLAQALAKDSAQNVTVNTTHDNLKQGGVHRIDIRKSPISVDAPYPVASANTAVVTESKLLDKIDVLKSVQQGGNIILLLPGVKDEDVEKKLPAAFKKAIAEHGIALYLIDAEKTTVEGEIADLESLIVQTAFLRIALGKSEEIGLQKLANVNSDVKTLEQVAADLEKTLRKIEVPKEWAELEVEESKVHLPSDVSTNSFASFDKTEEEPPSILRSWQKAAKGLLFKEAFNTESALRPDLPAKTFTVHVRENRRLTPITYDRNIFHIEFDLGTSGLKYDIGEALGIHAENDHDQVVEFIKWYGLNADDVVEVQSRDDPSIFENRTIYQSLIQNVDIFGRPPKKFYEALAEFADDEKEKQNLLTLAGPEGFKEFTRRAEVDTVTFADVLLEFPSAHPSFHEIVRIVAPMKRREYSIASCQAVTPTSVALMIVVVNWVDPKGRDRFGQATKYLAHMKVGTPVTVSVKPSVMKLPPKSTQPIIMAGLGTGLAPFRAFVQHRAMEKAQGKEIGSVLLYMGSRHQREEYCYGEEWEAYQAAGVITLLGRAFSRDQPQKIYIQDRMRQTIDDIVKAYIKEEGAFYLCGPTWPVPDVTNVLEEAIAQEAKASGAKKVDPSREIMKLKDTGRYVLEVY